jgi:hypothetical protein
MRIYSTTKRGGADCGFAYLETNFPEIRHEQFDPAFMRILFD